MRHAAPKRAARSAQREYVRSNGWFGALSSLDMGMTGTWSSTTSSLVLDRLRSEALTLSEADHAEVADALVTSLDGAPDSDSQDAWDRRIARRIGGMEAGTATIIDRSEFSRRMRGRRET